MTLFLDQSGAGVVVSSNSSIEIFLWAIVFIVPMVVLFFGFELRSSKKQGGTSSNSSQQKIEKYRHMRTHLRIRTDFPKGWQKITITKEEHQLLEPSDQFVLYLARLLKDDHNLRRTNNPECAGEKFWIDVNMSLLRKCYDHDTDQDIVLPQKGNNHNPTNYLARRIQEIEGILFKRKRAHCM